MTDAERRKLEAAAGFARTWADLLTSLDVDYGCTMTCGEAEAAAALLSAFGMQSSADYLIEVHSSTDEKGDDHYSGA